MKINKKLLPVLLPVSMVSLVGLGFSTWAIANTESLNVDLNVGEMHNFDSVCWIERENGVSKCDALQVSTNYETFALDGTDSTFSVFRVYLGVSLKYVKQNYNTATSLTISSSLKMKNEITNSSFKLFTGCLKDYTSITISYTKDNVIRYENPISSSFTKATNLCTFDYSFPVEGSLTEIDSFEVGVGFMFDTTNYSMTNFKNEIGTYLEDNEFTYNAEVTIS